MPFETRTFDLGNTLARAAEINSLRSRNKLNQLKIDEFNRTATTRNSINDAIKRGDAPNTLPQQFGQEGVDAATTIGKMKTALANGDSAQQDALLKRWRLMNDVSRNIIDSKNPLQSAHLALKNPEIAKMFPNADLTDLDQDDLLQLVSQIEEFTRFTTDPKELSEVFAGQEAVDRFGVASGTVVKQKSKGDQVTDVSVLQQPQKSPGANERELRIQDFMRTLGVDRPKAVKLDKGLMRVETDDFGRARLVDVVTGEVQEINIKPASGNEPIPAPEQSLFELTEDATGPEATVKAGFAQMVSIAGGPVTSPEVIQARTSFAIATNDFIRALTLNKRFPVKEIERIREEINLKPKFFDSPELMQNRMIAIDRSLRERQRKALNNANNTQLPEDTRKNAAGSAQDIEDFLNVLNVPPSIKEAPPEALQFLQDNPDKLSDFVKKYGFTPKGFE